KRAPDCPDPAPCTLRVAPRHKIEDFFGLRRLHPLLQVAEESPLFKEPLYCIVLIETADGFLSVQVRRRSHHRSLPRAIGRNESHGADNMQLLELIVVEVGYNEPVITVQRGDE